MSETVLVSQNYDVDLTPEPWALHLMGLINPLVVIAGNLLGGVYTVMGVVLVWGIGPILDVLMGESKQARPPRESGVPFETLLWVHGLLHFIVMFSFFYFAYYEAEISVWLVAAALSTGLCAATSAIVTAHELGHKPPKSAGWRLARMLLFSIHYSHFTTEHNHNHHKWVATDNDPASATKEQGLWTFWIKTIPGQFFSSVRVHNRKGRTLLRNPSLQGLISQVIALIVISQLPNGTVLLAGWLIASGIAILTLEYVNYIRHWGLRRELDERQTEMQSWNTEARWSRWTLLELTRHSDHHIRASVPFWQLRSHPDAPELPAGYYACWWPCLVPPLWKRWMRGRIPENTV
ncbi:MAG: fatty acid desaturase [Candidatus Thermoplasmatota archaeon]|nr:fatty acid desaturase [Candidatus Thermoplasmatota archaeon]